MKYETLTIVTGASGGIGLAVVSKLLAEGRCVVAIDVNTDNVSSLTSPNLIVYQLDVAISADLRAAIDDAAALGSIESLVCCAAVFPAASLADIQEPTWDEVFAINVEGTVVSCQAVIPHMLRRGGGSIVAFSSAMARTGGVNAAHYASTKGAILGLVRSLALDVAAGGIRVNSVSPGLTDTAQPRGNMSDSVFDARAVRIPMGRAGRPEEMAEAVSFLLSSDASYITGQDLRVTGGSALF